MLLMDSAPEGQLVVVLMMKRGLRTTAELGSRQWGEDRHKRTEYRSRRYRRGYYCDVSRSCTYEDRERVR